MGGNEDHRFVAILQVQGDVLEFADNGEIVLGQERVEILEDENSRFNLVDHLIQCGQRIFCGRVAMFLGLKRGAGGKQPRAVRPFEDFFLAFGCNGYDQVLDPRLLGSHDIQDRVTGPDQGLKFLLEVHQMIAI